MMPDRTLADLHRTAIHEAGHAVVAEVLAIGCTEVTNVPDWDEDVAGHSLSSAGDYAVLQAWKQRGIHHRDWRCALRATALVLLAGAAAECELLGSSGAGLGAGDDLRRAGWAVDDLTPAEGDVRATFARLERAVAVLVQRHRAAIATLADAVVEHRHLSGELLAQIIERVLAHSPAVVRHGPGARFINRDLAPWEVASSREEASVRLRKQDQ